MIIPLGTDDLESKAERAGRIRLENMYLIDSPYSPDGISRVSRPTLKTINQIGPGPINGMYRQDGTFNGDIFIVSGSNLYRYSFFSGITLLGEVPGHGFCEFVAGSDSILILRDKVAYWTDGATVTLLNMPDAAPVGSVAYIDSFFLLSVADTQRFYWIQPGASAPDALDFASAERHPDNIVSISVVADEIWIIGTSSIEVWVTSSDPVSPFQRIPGRAYPYGAVNNLTTVQSTTEGYSCLIWVTDKRTVAMAQGSPSRISNDSVEEILRRSDNFRAWGFEFNRHSFYILTCDDATFVYDLSKQTWGRWSSHDEIFWRAHLGVQDGTTSYAGDTNSNRIFMLEDGVADDDLPVVRTVSGLVISQALSMPCSRINVLMNSGWTNEYGSSDVLELRWSDDLGLTWGPYLSVPIGQLGAYGTSVSFSGLGLIRRPGRTFQFRFSDKSRFRLDYATMNER